MKHHVKFINDSPYGDYQEGDTGIVDGYVSGGDGVPCAVVIKDKFDTFVLAPLSSIKQI